MNTDGTGMTTLATSARLGFESVSISPDGRSVAVWEHDTIALLTPSGLRPVGSVPRGTVGPRDLVWSPDGRRIGFDVTDDVGTHRGAGHQCAVQGGLGLPAAHRGWRAPVTIACYHR